MKKIQMLQQRALQAALAGARAGATLEASTKLGNMALLARQHFRRRKLSQLTASVQAWQLDGGQESEKKLLTIVPFLRNVADHLIALPPKLGINLFDTGLLCSSLRMLLEPCNPKPGTLTWHPSWQDGLKAGANP